MTKQLTVYEHIEMAERYLNKAARYLDAKQDSNIVIANATVAVGIYLSVLLSQMYPLHEPPKEGDGE